MTIFSYLSSRGRERGAVPQICVSLEQHPARWQDGASQGVRKNVTEGPVRSSFSQLCMQAMQPIPSHSTVRPWICCSLSLGACADSSCSSGGKGWGEEGGGHQSLQNSRTGHFRCSVLKTSEGTVSITRSKLVPQGIHYCLTIHCKGNGLSVRYSLRLCVRS